MKKKRLAINMAANLIAFVIQIGVGFFLTPYLVNNLGREAYSFFPLANSFIAYAGILTTALNSMAGRFITIKIQQSDHEGANVYFNSVLTGNTVIALFLSIPAVLMVTFLDFFLNVPQEILGEVQSLFAIIFAGSLFGILTSVFGVATFARNRLDLSSLSSVGANILRVMFLIFLFYFFRPSISYIGIANFVAIAFVGFTNFRYTKAFLPEIKIHRKYYNINAIKELVSSGIWNSINQLSLVLMSGLDILIANIFIGASATGEYAIAKSMPMFLQSFVRVLVGVFVPELTILYAQDKKDEFRVAMDKSMKFLQIMMTIPLGFLMVYGDSFFDLWVPGQNSSKLFLFSSLTIIPMVVSTSIETIFHAYTITNKLKIPALALLVTGIINTLITLILLKYTTIGLLVIPLVSLATSILEHLTFTSIYAARILNYKWNTFHQSIFHGVSNFLLVILICWITKQVFVPDSWITFFAIFTLCGLFSLALNAFFTLNKEERRVFLGLFRSLIKKFGK